MDTFITAVYAARLVALGDAARAFLGQSFDDEPEVVSLRVTASFEGSGGLGHVEWELVGAHGLAIGGGTA